MVTEKVVEDLTEEGYSICSACNMLFCTACIKNSDVHPKCDIERFRNFRVPTGTQEENTEIEKEFCGEKKEKEEEPGEGMAAAVRARESENENAVTQVEESIPPTIPDTPPPPHVAIAPPQIQIESVIPSDSLPPTIPDIPPPTLTIEIVPSMGEVKESKKRKAENDLPQIDEVIGSGVVVMMMEKKTKLDVVPPPVPAPDVIKIATVSPEDQKLINLSTGGANLTVPRAGIPFHGYFVSPKAAEDEKGKKPICANVVFKGEEYTLIIKDCTLSKDGKELPRVSNALLIPPIPTADEIKKCIGDKIFEFKPPCTGMEFSCHFCDKLTISSNFKKKDKKKDPTVIYRASCSRSVEFLRIRPLKSGISLVYNPGKTTQSIFRDKNLNLLRFPAVWKYAVLTEEISRILMNIPKELNIETVTLLRNLKSAIDCVLDPNEELPTTRQMNSIDLVSELVFRWYRCREKLHPVAILMDMAHPCESCRKAK